MNKDSTEYHWFGSTNFGWRVSNNLAELIDLLKDCGHSGKVKKGDYYWIVKVPTDIKSSYKIKNYLPDVEGKEIVEMSYFKNV